MPHITRFTVDLVTEEPLSERRQEMMAGEISENLHLLVIEPEDEMINVLDKYVNGHTHDATQERCPQCYYHCRDSKNGDVVAG